MLTSVTRFPRACVKELESIHQQAKVYKANLFNAPVTREYK